MRNFVLVLGFFFLLVMFSLPSCKVNKLANEVEMRDYYSDNQMFVQVVSMDKVDKLKADFDKYGLEIVKEVSTQLKMVMIEYDNQKITPQKMKVKLEMMDYVTSTDFAKETGGK